MYVLTAGLVTDNAKSQNRQDEIITPHQTTLLKIVDSYLQSIQLSATTTQKTIQIHAKLSPMLAKVFFALSGYAQGALERALRPPPISDPDRSDTPASEPAAPVENTGPVQPPPPAELDVMLPKVCEALVLVTQCIVTIALESDEQNAPLAGSEPGPKESDLKGFFIEVRASKRGIVESLIGNFPAPNPLNSHADRT